MDRGEVQGGKGRFPNTRTIREQGRIPASAVHQVSELSALVSESPHERDSVIERKSSGSLIRSYDTGQGRASRGERGEGGGREIEMISARKIREIKREFSRRQVGGREMSTARFWARRGQSARTNREQFSIELAEWYTRTMNLQTLWNSQNNLTAGLWRREFDKYFRRTETQSKITASPVHSSRLTL